MEDTPSLLRKLLAEHPAKLKPFCDEHGLPYFRMRDFLAGRGPGLRLGVAEKLSKILTGKPLHQLANGEEGL